VGHGSAPRLLWLDADRLVRDALTDLDRGKSVSVPGKRYKVITTAVRHLPASLLSRFQDLGRR
jgi:short-subunit dehydrogenase